MSPTQKYFQKFTDLKPFTLVCVGDSTTSQEWCHPNWVDWLTFVFKQQPPWPRGLVRRVINSGKDGAFIHDFLNNFETEIGMFKPDVVLVSLGFNNIELSGSADIEAQLRQLFSLIKDSGADVLTWSTYDVPHTEHSHSLAVISQQYKKITQEFSGVFVDIYSEFKHYDLESLFTYKQIEANELWNIPAKGRDYLHCNEIGNQIIAECIAKQAFGVELMEWPDMGSMILTDLASYKRK